MKRVLIDARMRDGQAGGIQQVVLGLAQGFSQVDTSGYDIRFLVLDGHSAWLQPFLGLDQKLMVMPYSQSNLVSKNGLATMALNCVRNTIGRIAVSASVKLPKVPDCVSSWNPELIHFYQNIFKAECKFIFTPHDFQHEYYPKNFDSRTLMVRRYLYRKHCQDAARVACISRACLKDVVKFTGLNEAKCSVVYNAAPTLGYSVPTPRALKELS